MATVAPRSAATAQPFLVFYLGSSSDNISRAIISTLDSATCAGKMVIVLKNFIGGEFVETKNTSSDNVIER